MNLRESRFALLDAVNAHDLEAIKAFVDPSYSARGLGGLTVMGYDQMADYAARMFADHPDYRETLEIESEHVDGETGKLTTRRTESFKASMGIEQTRVARQVETWRQVDGRWLIVEEQAEGPSETARISGLLKGLRHNAGRPVRSVGLLVACAVVIVASFLPWGSIPMAVNFGEVGEAFAPFNIFGGVRLTMNGWNGHLSLPGLKIPNWSLVVGAVVIAAFHWMASGSVWTPHPLINVLIAAYGIVHVVALALLMLFNKGDINIGLIATLAAYLVILFILIKELRVGKAGVSAEISGG